MLVYNKYILTQLACLVSPGTFTVGGNSFGLPCHFPFKFLDQWYTECTVDGEPNGQLWCATEVDYDTTEKWGFCATQGESETKQMTEV